MSIEQRDDYIISNVALGVILIASVLCSLLFAGVLVAVQIAIEIKDRAKLRRLKYAENDEWVECKQLIDPQAYHLFLSHAWPAAQDRSSGAASRPGTLSVLPVAVLPTAALHLC